MPGSPSLRASPIGVRHPLLTTIRKGIQKGGLTDDGFCVAEGFHLLDEAIRAECEIAAVVMSDSSRGAVESRGLQATQLHHLPDKDFQALAATETSQGVISVIRPGAWTMEQLFAGTALVVVLDGIQDPGNAGTIVRSAEAFGASGVLALKGTVNLYNPKCLRASAGSIFRLPCVASDDLSALSEVSCYAAVPSGAIPIYQADFRKPTALIIGSEGRGVSPRLRALAQDLVIPTKSVESLNAAIAASILLFEASRQRESI